jgi:hypothetical protein
MTPPFVVRTIPCFERLFRSLTKRYRELYELRHALLVVLSTDPHNHSGTYPIRKLRGFAQRPLNSPKVTT